MIVQPRYLQPKVACPIRNSTGVFLGPKLLVIPIFQIDFGVPGNPAGEQVVRRRMPYSDAIGRELPASTRPILPARGR